jgi:hypothetical protein
MWHGMRRNVLVTGLVITSVSVLAPGAMASISPELSLDQSAGTTAGSTANLGLDMKFAPTGTDSPDQMTLTLPPGLLANASIDGGGCLTTADLTDNACEVGSGTVTADAYGTIPITTPVTFDLVPPPGDGDLAGLAVNSSGTQIGSTAAIRVRPSGDPAGVGVTIGFTLPNTLDGVPISVAEIKSTFDGLRYPSTCPSTPQNVTVAVDSYGDATVRTVSAPLSVTGCSGLSYAPAFAVSATRDSGDEEVRLTTQITQTAGQAPSRSVTLAFLGSVLAPNLGSVKSLCQSPSSGACTPVGSATATSPLYPKPFTGQAYLTGSFNGLSLTLVFPPPFPLTLVGTVDLVSNATAFTGLPDIPLTDLAVTLNSGPSGLFGSTCRPTSGTATADLTDQNGDKTAHLPVRFAVAGCPASAGGGSMGVGATGPPRLTASTVSGLGSGHPSLSFTVTVPRRAARVAGLTVELPSGLSFIGRHAGKRLTVAGVSVRGARLRSLRLSRGDLAITLGTALPTIAVKIGPAALRESAALRARARAHRLTTVRLTVIVTNAKGRRTTIHVHARTAGL